MAIPVSAELAPGWRLSLVLNEGAFATARTFVGRREVRVPFVVLNGCDDILATPGNEADVAAVGALWMGPAGWEGPVVASARMLNPCRV